MVKATDRVHIIDSPRNDPPFPFVIVGSRGLHVDLSNIQGQLWDENTVQKVTWGLK